jgi:hypothetical protein
MGGRPHLTIGRGATSNLVFLFATEPGHPGDGRSGLRHDGPGAGAAFVREGHASGTIGLTAGEVGRFAPGSFVEVDPELLPGVYQFGVPDEVLSAGASEAMLVFRFEGAVVEPVEVSIVAYDPTEPTRIGMRCLEWEQRWSFLRQGLPRLAEMELALQREPEGGAADGGLGAER